MQSSQEIKQEILAERQRQEAISYRPNQHRDEVDVELESPEDNSSSNGDNSHENVTLVRDTKRPKRIKLRNLTYPLGAVIGAILGTLTAVVVYNPLASLFGAVSQFANQKSLKNAGRVLVSPVWGPLKGIFYHGFYEQGLKGWNEGFKTGAYAVVKVPKQATLKLDNVKHPRISTRNIIASLIIAGLIAVAVVGVFFPLTFGIAAILPTVLATLHISGVSSVVLGLIAGAATFVTASLLYSLVVNTYDVLARPRQQKRQGFSTMKDPSVEPLLDESEHTHTDKKLSKMSKLAGAVTGAIIGALTAALVKNPVASLYTLFRRLWNVNPEISLSRKAFLGVLVILAPIWLPLVSIFQHGIYEQGKRGWELGFAKILDSNDEDKKKRSAFRHVIEKPKKLKVYQRDFVASLLVIGLIVASVLAVVVTPVSLFLGIPALAATIGLGSVGTAVLAVIAGAATFVASTLVYGIGSQLVDLYIERKEAAKHGRPLTNTATTDLNGSSYTHASPKLGSSKRLEEAQEPIMQQGTTRGTSLWSKYAPTCLGGDDKSTGYIVTQGSPYLEVSSNDGAPRQSL